MASSSFSKNFAAIFLVGLECASSSSRRECLPTYADDICCTSGFSGILIPTRYLQTASPRAKDLNSFGTGNALPGSQALFWSAHPRDAERTGVRNCPSLDSYHVNASGAACWTPIYFNGKCRTLWLSPPGAFSPPNMVSQFFRVRATFQHVLHFPPDTFSFKLSPSRAQRRLNTHDNEEASNSKLHPTQPFHDVEHPLLPLKGLANTYSSRRHPAVAGRRRSDSG